MVLLAAKTPCILAHAYVEDHSLAHQKWYEPVRSPWDSVPDNTVVPRRALGPSWETQSVIISTTILFLDYLY
jgi:hypothetical protein